MNDLKTAIDRWDETMEALPPDLSDEHWHRLAVVEQHASRVVHGIPTPFCLTHNRTVPSPSFTGHSGHHSQTEGCRIVEALIVVDYGKNTGD